MATVAEGAGFHRLLDVSSCFNIVSFTVEATPDFGKFGLDDLTVSFLEGNFPDFTLQGPPACSPAPCYANGVIHSFWVPAVNGKKDVVPGRKQFLKLEADKPGTYLGQCAEYCGLSHADMRLRVIAQTPTDYEAWVKSLA